MRVLTLVNSGLFCEGGIDTLLSFFLGVGGGGVQKNFCAPPGYFSCGGTEDLLKPLKPQKTATFPKQFEKPSNFWKKPTPKFVPQWRAFLPKKSSVIEGGSKNILGPICFDNKIRKMRLLEVFCDIMTLKQTLVWLFCTQFC